MLRILLIGLTGMGKSRFVNECAKAPLVETNSDEPETDRIYKCSNILLDGETVTLYDTPGFNGTTGPTNAVILVELERVIVNERINSIYYVNKAARPRFMEPEAEVLGILSQKKHPFLALPWTLLLTHMDQIPRDRVEQRIRTRRREIEVEIQKQQPDFLFRKLRTTHYFRPT